MGAHLQRRGAFMDDLGGVPQRPARLVLALGRDNLGPGLPGSLGLGSHGALELLGHSDILHLHPLHHDTPGLRALVQHGLNRAAVRDINTPVRIPITFISLAMASLLQRMSPSVMVPSTFLSVVAASSRAEPL